MNIIRTALLLTLFSAAAVSNAAYAQREPFKPAPVPGLNPGLVTPADRAGRTLDNNAPFSASPVLQYDRDMPRISSAVDRDTVQVPNLGR